MEDLILLEEDRAKLDGIVQEMIGNNESEDNIQFVVNSISLIPSKFEVEKEVGEIKKYIKLTLVGS